jgi:hypothetical protein
MNDLKAELTRLLSAKGITRGYKAFTISTDAVNETEEYSPAHDGMEDDILGEVDDKVVLERVRNALTRDELRILVMRSSMPLTQMAEVFETSEYLITKKVNEVLRKARDAAE